jgi:hypothetical protein
MLNNNITYIYSLSHPITKEIRYIGKANNPLKRLNFHLEEAKKIDSKTTFKINWIRKLIKQHLKPEVNIIDKVYKEDWEFWEKFYINLYRNKGYKLVNGTNGGEGNMYWQKHHTEETKQKISKAHKGKKFSEEHKLKLGIKKIGNKNAVGHKGSIRINKKIYQINFNKKIVNIWNNACEIMVNVFNKGTNETSLIHYICKSKGKRTYHNYFWIYDTDLNKRYNIGDKVEELELRTKNKEVIAINKENKLLFKSMTEAAKYLKVSNVTIGNYIKSQKPFNGFIFKFNYV